MSNFTIQVEKYCIDNLVWFAASGVQLTIVKMNALYLIKKIGARLLGEKHIALFPIYTIRLHWLSLVF